MPDPVNYGRFGFTVRKGTLSLLCDQALAAVPPGTPALPVYGCFRVTVKDGTLELAGTDMRRTVWAATSAVAVNGQGQAYVPARWLRDILAEVPDGQDVIVSVSGAQAVVKAGTPRWTKKLPGPRNYPELPDITGLELAPVPREPLLRALKTVRHAVGKDMGRPEYTQVHVDQAEVPGGKAWFASASDSSRFCRAPVPGFPFPVDIPAAALEDLLRLLAIPAETAQVGQAGNALVFRAGPVTFAVIKMGTDFPDEEGTVLEPARRESTDLLAVDKAALRQAVRRVMISSDVASSAVLLTARAGELAVEARDVDGNDARDVIPARWEADGERQLVVSGRFLDAMLAAHPSPECSFRLGTGTGRALPRVLLEDDQAQVTFTMSQLGRQDTGY